MKVVITSEGSTMEDPVDPRFGRCRTFLLADTETAEVRAVSNEAATQAGGAGIQAAKSVVDLGAEAVISGQLGPKAAQVFAAQNIPVYVGASGSARQALEALKAGRPTLFQEGGPGTGMGRGMGGGRGRGMGRGRGGGTGRDSG